MSSIFKTLFNLKLKSSNQPHEDYLTEIFAFCLESDKELMAEFFRAFNIHITEYEVSNVSTQFYIKALEHHDSDSKPDLAIFLDCKTIFIESKISSTEGYLQLKRYAEHLDEFATEKTLVYLTRDFDPKKKSEIVANCKNKQDINFIQIRWHQVYSFLKNYSLQTKQHIGIIKQLIKYMSESGLSINNQFSPIDILTLSNFNRVRKMMDETMFGEVDAKFQKIAGKICKPSAMLSQVRRHDRYIYYTDQNAGMWVGLGFWLNPTNKQYPDLKIIIEVDPNSIRRKEILEAFNSIKKTNTGWLSYGINNPSAWASIQIIKNLQTFLSREDHVKEIKDFYIEAIEKLDNVKTNYPHLPWL